MKPVTSSNYNIALEILTKAYYNNPGTNLVVGVNGKKRQRLEYLMRYAINKSKLHNGAFISDDYKGILLFLNSNKPNLSFKVFLNETFLFFRVIGLRRILPVLKREKVLKRNHPKSNEYLHLWFLGVAPSNRNNGIGSNLVKEMIKYSVKTGIKIIVETVELENFYKKLGFVTYKKTPGNILNYSFMIYQTN